VDVLLLTHSDADHVGGMQAVLERYRVGTVIEAPSEHESTVYESWQRAVEAHGGSTSLSAGSVVALDDGVTLEVLTAGPPFPDAAVNDASIVTMLRYGEVSVLLTGDITALAERRLLASGKDLHATVLKVSHHGSGTSSTAEFLAAVDPAVAVIQVGDDNIFGHPDSEVVERLLTLVPAENLFITALHGDVTFRTDGQKAWVETER
jgi:beta-lactamase superfamily II metal-dependent hydrolase